MPSVYKSTCPPGSLHEYMASGVANGNFLPADGTLRNIADYPDLAAVFGTTYGGDGVTTFGLPDTRGRSHIGEGQGSGLSNRSIGQTGGEESHQLSLGELPSHNHGGGDHGHSGVAVTRGGNSGTGRELAIGDGVNFGTYTPSVNNSGSVINTQGSDQGHNNMQPFYVASMMVKV